MKTMMSQCHYHLIFKWTVLWDEINDGILFFKSFGIFGFSWWRIVSASILLGAVVLYKLHISGFLDFNMLWVVAWLELYISDVKVSFIPSLELEDKEV